MAKVKLTTIDEPYTGMHVDFIAPCDCTIVEGIVINDVDYAVVDTLGVAVTGNRGTWAEGSMVSVLLDCQNHKAYVLNAARSTQPTLSQANPNLLDNWYFLNPVNQRGESSYTVPEGEEETYCFDRWKLWGDTQVLKSSGKGLRFWYYGEFIQILENVLPKDEYTFSVLFTAPTVKEITLFVQHDTSSHSTMTIPEGSVGVFSLTVTDTVELVSIMFDHEDADATIGAVKLERGNAQTLAYQDVAGEWHLTEIPDFGEQLARCQRFYVRYNTSGVNFFVGMGMANSFGNSIYFQLAMPVPMRVSPAISTNGTDKCFIHRMNGSYVVTEVTRSYYDKSPDGHKIMNMYIKTSDTLDPGASYFFKMSTGFYLEFSADM